MLIKKIISFSIILHIILFSYGVNTLGITVPYKGYIYNSNGESVEVPEGYNVSSVLYSDNIELISFKNPTDLFVTIDKRIFILDSGNDRIVVMNDNLETIKIISKFKYNNEVISISQSTGFFITENNQIYIADKGNSRIIISDFEGNISRIMGKPRSELIPSDYNYLPSKIAIDKRGVIYVLSEHGYSGILTFTPQGEFIGFFGANRVEVTPAMILDRFWRSFMTQDQLDSVIQYTPIEYSNFYIDKDGFVYACVKNTINRSEQIKKINAKGLNVLTSQNSLNESNQFGDIEYNVYRGQLIDSVFGDLTVDNNGIITAVDMTRGRIFQYDQNGLMLFAFGESDNRKGGFVLPVAVENFGDNLIILDSAKSTLTIMEKSVFGNKVHMAINLYNEGEFEKSAEYWNEVLIMCSNYEMAYMGIGRALLMVSESKAAMDYFVLGQDRGGYSNALRDYRTIWISQNFAVLVLGAFILTLIYFTFAKRKKLLCLIYNNSPYKEIQKAGEYNKINVRNIIFHPFDGFAEMKYKKSYSIKSSFIILGLYFASNIFNKLETGFQFNYIEINQFNVLSELAFTLGLFVLWVIANWSLSTLMDGEGKFSQIWIFSSYSLIPRVITLIPMTIISKFLTLPESGFLSIFNTLILIWCSILFFMAIKDVHDFSLGKTIWCISISIVGVLVIIFLGVLVFSMFQQFFIFLNTIFNELVFRL